MTRDLTVSIPAYSNLGLAHPCQEARSTQVTGRHNKAQSRPDAGLLHDTLTCSNSSSLDPFADHFFLTPSLTTSPLDPAGGCGRHVIPYVIARRPSSPEATRL